MALYYTVFILLSLFLMFLIYKVVKLQWRESYKEELDYRFKQVWSGREGEELHAWYFVKFELIKYSAREKHLRYVQKKIDELDKKKILSKYVVDESGNVESSVSSGDLSYR